MSEIRTTGIAVRIEPFRAWMGAGAQSALEALGHAGSWFGDTAQKFASLLSDLMGPGIFTAYSLTAWSLASNLGWTGPFLVSRGPLSNWLVWLGFAVTLNVAASILKRRTQTDASRSDDPNGN
ncbi:MAG: hypothetical protein ACJ746_27840 [Bryobacteraceae bacterium]